MKEVPSELQGYRRVASDPDRVASEPKVVVPPSDQLLTITEPLPVQAEGVRIAKIIVVFTVLAPLIAGGGLLVLEIFYASFIEPAPHSVKKIGMGVIPTAVAIMALPWALVTSTLYACVAVWSGWRNVLIALAIMLLPMLLFYSPPREHHSFWNSGPRDLVVVLVVVPTIVCWILTRRWHSPNP